MIIATARPHWAVAKPGQVYVMPDALDPRVDIVHKNLWTTPAIAILCHPDDKPAAELLAIEFNSLPGELEQQLWLMEKTGLGLPR